MVRQHAAFEPSTRPRWAHKGPRFSHNCPAPENFVNQEMLKLVDFRLAVNSDLAARNLRLPLDVVGKQARTEIRWAWLRIDRATGAGWVRVDHVYSPLECSEGPILGSWWRAGHRGDYIFTRWSIWVPLLVFMETYPRFQRMPNPHLQDAVPSFVGTGPFYSAPWWRQAPVKDEDEVFPWMSEEDEAALLGDSCDFDKKIWFKRVKQGNPERVLDGQAAYDEWWRVFDLSGQSAAT